jgi:SAM-dependent methyltransferase
MIIFLNLLTLFLLLIPLAYFVLLFWHVFLTKDAPFICIPGEVVPDIVKALEIDDESVVYDLGCGDGRVLVGCYKVNPRAKYVGVDKDFAALWRAKAELAKVKNPFNIEIIKEDIFASDIKNATHVFLYLYPKVLNRLLTKLKAELKKGTTVVTCDYFFEGMEPQKVIDLNRPVNSLGRRLYVYKF